MLKIPSFCSSEHTTSHTQNKGYLNESSQQFDIEESFTDSLCGSIAEGHESILIQKIPHLAYVFGQSSNVTDTEQVLYRFVMAGDLNSCKDYLNSHRIDANKTYEDGNTLIHIAAAQGDIKICQALLDYGDDTNINSLNSRLSTPLHLSSEKGHLQVSQLLIRSGADLNKQDRLGNTPLHLACSNQHYDLVSWMLTRNPETGLKNSENKLPEDLSDEKIQQIFQKHYKRTILAPGPSLNMKIKPQPIKSVQCDSPQKIKPSDFEVLKELGKGSFGEVFLVRKQDTKELFAMKVLQKEKILSQHLIKYALTERNVLTYLDHPFIVSLKYAFQTPERLFLILDYCPGGDLGHHLAQEKRFTEYRARLYLCEIILALEELHKRNIIFRDLKPDNIVIDNEGHALLTDFGLSKEHIKDNNQARSFCGSLAYLAPEVIRRQGHGKAVDWYLLGVVFYEMIIGKPPYFSMDKKELIQNIQKGKLKIPASLSSEAKELIIDVWII